MTSESRRETAARIKSLLDGEGPTLRDGVREHNDRRYEATSNWDAYEDCRDAARERKEAAIENLPSLIEQVRGAVEANGGHVTVAPDAGAANRYVESLIDAPADATVVKSKSMTTEEIGLRRHLEGVGADVFETDLGEFVVQLADESPSHIVGPALHKSQAEIADLFEATFDLDRPLRTAEDLTSFARSYLGEQIRSADVGITGANFVLAESGSIVLVTNEGNARKSAVVPDTHVAVAGVEKLLPSVADLRPFVELIGRSATGQDVPQYLSILSPPVDTPSIDFDAPSEPLSGAGDREFHLVLVDNGRLAMREDPHLRETLYCIRCGACLNSCANFQQVGGHGFGGETYSGGIGTGWIAGLEGPSATAEFNDLCSACSRCVPNCPVKIDIPWINTVVRDRRNRGSPPAAVDHLVGPLAPDEEPDGLDLQKRFFGNVDTILELGSATAPLSNWLLEAPGIDRLLERVVGIDRERSFPSLATETLPRWWDRREKGGTGDRGRVHLYADLYTSFLFPERGRAAVRVLEALGYDVALTEVVASGRAPLSQGMIETATRQAEELAGMFEQTAAAGEPVLVVEPSDLALFRTDYERLLEDPAAEAVQARTDGLMAFLADRIPSPLDPDAVDAGPVFFHGNCQQRSAGFEAPTVETLSRLGYDVRTSDVECCGMAGSFGYKTQFYDLSMAVGEELAGQLPDPAARDVVASGTSCVSQIGALRSGEKPPHPVELVDRDWARTPGRRSG